MVASRQGTSPAAPLRWDDVRLFLALCRSRTLGGAARALGVDASTVSRRLAGLERSPSASLFGRGRDPEVVWR
ncbi:MAG: helix-turn-helix domain-containing protein [Myxococcaceae bacterium]